MSHGQAIRDEANGMPSSPSSPPPPTKASLLRWWKVFKHTHNNNNNNNNNSTTTEGGNTPNKTRARAATAPTTGIVLPVVPRTTQDSSTKYHGGHNKNGASTSAAAVAEAARAYRPPGRGLAKGKSGEGRVFGVSPEQSLKYAAVAISTAGSDGRPYVYGYVPIVVAKCGMMLKESATATEGIFRVSGSNKRINQLQAIFDEPPRYGKDLDWNGYSVHDAASVLRRYLNMMPDPVIPAHLYVDFVHVLQRGLPEQSCVAEYQRLISLLPPTSRYLLLYLLDFLSVFVRSSHLNLMTASNLAVVFQPGLVSTRLEGTGAGALLGFPGFVDGKVPLSSAQAGLIMLGSTSAAGSPLTSSTSQVAGEKALQGAGEHGRGKEVLEFLIEQQSCFMVGLEPPNLGASGSGSGRATPIPNSAKSHHLATSTNRDSKSRSRSREPTSEQSRVENVGGGGGAAAAAMKKKQQSDDYTGPTRTSSKGKQKQRETYEENENLSPGQQQQQQQQQVSSLNLPHVSSPPPLQQHPSSSSTSTAASSFFSGLNRRGSEKSVERRRLRKAAAADGSNAKVKRSKTLPGRSSSLSYHHHQQQQHQQQPLPSSSDHHQQQQQQRQTIQFPHGSLEEDDATMLAIGGSSGTAMSKVVSSSGSSTSHSSPRPHKIPPLLASPSPPRSISAKHQRGGESMSRTSSKTSTSHPSTQKNAVIVVDSPPRNSSISAMPIPPIPISTLSTSTTRKSPQLVPAAPSSASTLHSNPLYRSLGAAVVSDSHGRYGDPTSSKGSFDSMYTAQSRYSNTMEGVTPTSLDSSFMVSATSSPTPRAGFATTTKTTTVMKGDGSNTAGTAVRSPNLPRWIPQQHP